MPEKKAPWDEVKLVPGKVYQVDTLLPPPPTVELPYNRIMRKAQEIRLKKAHDYSRPDDLHSNFKYAEAVAAPFPEWAKPYAILIGVKLARLAELYTKGGANFESEEDSAIDLVNYAALMGERAEEERK